MEIDFTRLRYFLAVAEELHFKRAADRLMITPPPLSKQIKVLERELGGALFEREYHEVRLTTLGEALVEPVRRVLEQAADLKEIADRVTGRDAPVRVGVTAYAPSDFLDAFETVVTAIPDIAVTVDIAGSAIDVTSQLVDGHLDLGIIHLPTTEERIRYQVLARWPAGVAIRGDDPLAARTEVTIEDLCDREIIIDFARPNPPILADLTRRLNARGVHKIVHGTNTGRGSELEMALQARRRRLVVLIPYAPSSALARIFAAPDFTLRPIAESSWKGSQVALAWAPERVRQRPSVATVMAHVDRAFPQDSAEPAGDSA